MENTSGRIPITRELQEQVIKRELVNSKPVLKITPGMWEHLREMSKRSRAEEERVTGWGLPTRWGILALVWQPKRRRPEISRDDSPA